MHLESCLNTQQMTIHNLYIFDRDGQLLHYTEWNRKKQSGVPKEEASCQ